MEKYEHILVQKSLNRFELRVRIEGSTTPWEKLLPHLIISASDKPVDAKNEYMKFLKNNDVDTSVIKEIRVNRSDGLQGHYFRIND